LTAGLIGLPFFSGFRGGISVLFSPTGGFLIGFLFFPIITLLFRKTKNDILKLTFAFIISLILLYALQQLIQFLLIIPLIHNIPLFSTIMSVF